MWCRLSRESPPHWADPVGQAQKLSLDSGRPSVSKYVLNSLGYWSQIEIPGPPRLGGSVSLGEPRTPYFSHASQMVLMVGEV